MNGPSSQRDNTRAAAPIDWILVVDDEPDVRSILVQGLRAMGYSCESAADATEAVARLAERPFALMLTDVRMPRISGLQLLQFVRTEYPDLAVIIATASDDRQTAVLAMRSGAYDFIAKPFNLEEVGFALRRALDKRRLALEVQAYRQSLERQVVERTAALADKNEELQRMMVNAIRSIALTLEARDEYTAHHSYRVATLAVRLARHHGLDEEVVEQVRLAALLHDIGKIGIRESVLHKAGKLTEEEMEHIKSHPLVAEQILRPLKQLEAIIPPIKHEHEAWDGSGYPDGLVGEAIPLASRIISIADAYDALTSDRPYRAALPQGEAMAIIHEGGGHIWDPTLVALFEKMMAGEQALPGQG